MIRLSALTGLPVIHAGRSCGCVEQAVLTPDGLRLRGLIVRHGLGGARWVDEADIACIGTVSVIAEQKPGRVPPDADFALTSVKDTGGLLLGRVTDVWLDPETRRTGALEVSLGLMETLTGGRLLARQFVACPVPEDPGRVLVPCGMPMEHVRPVGPTR